MDRLHVGRGTTRGALSVFPIWGEYDRPKAYTLCADTVMLSELTDGPRVERLMALNGGERPVLFLEGQLLEGGWQNRMLCRSVLVPARTRLPLEVACVEAHRWNGTDRHQLSGRRASMRVRNTSGSTPASQTQHEVWQRISEYDAQFGVNETSSLTEHTVRATKAVDELVDRIEPLPGQTGVLIGISGQPVMLEAFDSPTTLRHQFRSIVRAAGLDALDQRPEPTPARRAFRFVDRATLVSAAPTAPAGAGTTVHGRSQYAVVTGLAWRRHLVHLSVINPRHTLNAARIA
ncbi:ARPP-1 family domain-containing protein [Knoellia sp. CPCC 206435]|uniref:ARPP-1 family domain-containing protein n=1 Tax=Knoellia terrae TaxID=3404797 RepID=UPI003B430030